MNFDIHYHTIMTKMLPFSVDYLRDSMRAASQAGLDAVIATDHADSLSFDVIRTRLAENFERRGDAFLVEGVLVFPGIEVDVAEGPHVLIAAPARQIDDLYRRIEGKLIRGNPPSVAELFAMVADYERLMVCAHPFRPEREITLIPEELRSRFDAYDLNGRDLSDHGHAMLERMLAYGRTQGVPVVAGSDTHHHLQAGCVSNGAVRWCDTVADLRTTIRNGDYEVRVEPWHAVRVAAARTIKGALKRQMLQLRHETDAII